MKITYDKIADAAYIYLKTTNLRSVISETVPITSDLNIDINAKGEALGIEILNAKSYLGAKNLRSSKQGGIDLPIVSIA